MCIENSITITCDFIIDKSFLPLPCKKKWHLHTYIYKGLYIHKGFLFSWIE